jgi:adenosylhomocysteine/aminodeoxyfutalosine nucleosidase
MTIGIMGAMPEEIEPILAKIGNYEKIKYANNTYYKANYNNVSLIIAYSKIGKVFSTLTASNMINKFSCEMILFSGVAGGINPSLKIGDLIIATSLCQHDLDITAFGHPYGYVPEGKVFIDTSKKLNNIAKEIAKNKNISLTEGVIATGDQFISSNEKKEFIRNTFKADALEMEGASVALVCGDLDCSKNYSLCCFRLKTG